MTLLFVLGLSLAAALRRELQYRARAEWLARESARRHAEALAHLHVLFENSPDAMFVVLVAPDGRLTYDRVNPSWERVTGIPASMALGRSPAECLPEYLSRPVVAAWSDCVREGQPRRYAVTLTPPNQASDWEVALAPVCDDSGRICRLIGVGRNMTERNKFAANMLQVQRMEAIGQLTTGVAHDFNNLLQAIVVALEMLQEQPGLDDEGRCSAAIAENAALRGASLVHQLLAFSRKQSLNPSLLRVEQVVPEVAALLSRTLGGRIIVETRTRGGVWPVLADRAQLENCLLNLALNARDAMPDGGTLLLEAANAGPDAARSAGLAAGDYVCIRIEDEGMGMAPDTLARAFEPFFTTKSVGQGTGLGLSMVQGFARQSGGDVMIESIEGRGTLVNLWLPRAADAAGAASGLDRPQTAERGRGTVVLVDDDQDVRDMLARVLGKAGFKTAVAASGAAALDMLQAGQACDVLISDQSMPGITGSELIAKVAHIRPGLATILITGFDKVTGLDNLDGQVTVLRKPFKRDVFLGEVEALLRRGAAHQAGLTALPEPAAP
jgi:PAS domain S-box-containing protein